jgi:N-glycosylase/DNA lyase
MAKDLIINNISPFDLALTLDCGQAFRWTMTSDDCFEGVAMGKFLKIKQQENSIIFYNTSKEEYDTIWKGYFDFDRDYNEILLKASKNEILKNISQNCGGIRLLKQDPWEALCSFIISQNNNIPRIKGIINRLCENYGEKIEGGFTFPTAEKLATLTVEDLAPLRAGFRAKYIIDAAKKCSSEIDLSSLHELTLDNAREVLMKIKGVGPKVADCTLLFGLGFHSAFPMDVWMKRAMAVLFNNKLPEGFEYCAGVIQQYIFHYARTNKITFEDKK